jgi:hypothetical protein
MSIATDIIRCQMPDFDRYLAMGESLDDIDEYGFTPLIETIITRQPHITQKLLTLGVDVNKPDVTGRTALHWAVDNADQDIVLLLLKHGANPNVYTTSGLSVLVYPVLRGQNSIKHLLYQYGAKLDFALDFICAKLLGHRFELEGDVDIVTAAGEFIELDYEGFILEFTVAIVKDSLRRMMSSYSTRNLRPYFSTLHGVMDGFSVAEELLSFQHQPVLTDDARHRLSQLLQAPTLVLPAASRGHAFCFVRYQNWWAKIDRGENSLKEGSVNIYRITRPETLTPSFLQEFLYKKQPRAYFHEVINRQLGLEPVLKLPIASQIVGNCSWANVQAVVPVAYALQQLHAPESFSFEEALMVYEAWVEWDKDRALDDCVQRFYLANTTRKASFVSMLAAVLFQSCDAGNMDHLRRAEKIMPILTLPEYYYVLKSYLDTYCVKRLTRKGNNLLKLLDECGINPGLGVTPIATGLKDGP